MLKQFTRVFPRKLGYRDKYNVRSEDEPDVPDAITIGPSALVSVSFHLILEILFSADFKGGYSDHI